MTARYVADEAALREALWGHTMVMRDTSEGAIFGCKCGAATGSHPDHLATALLASGVVQSREDAMREAKAEALLDAASPRRIMRWAEGPCDRGMPVAAVMRYLADCAAETRPIEDGPRNTSTGSAT